MLVAVRNAYCIKGHRVDVINGDICGSSGLGNKCISYTSVFGFRKGREKEKSPSSSCFDHDLDLMCKFVRCNQALY